MGAGLHLLARRSDGTDIPVEISLSPPQIEGELFAIAAVRDIGPRLTAEAELQASRDALREAEQILAVSSDRERIARDLHDTVIQRPPPGWAAGGRVGPRRPRSHPGPAHRHDRRPRRDDRSRSPSSAAGQAGCREDCEQILDVTSVPSVSASSRVQFDGPIETIDDDIAEQLVPVVREALANVAKHSGATHVRVGLRVADRVTLTITDDGTGIPEQVIGGRGVANMTARADELDGQLTLENQPTGGVCLVWDDPPTDRRVSRCGRCAPGCRGWP
jgi:signal transduction histidine kinase